MSLNGFANLLLVLMALALTAVLGFIVLLAPWWLTAAAAVALVAVWPAHKRWMRREAAHRAYMARRSSPQRD